MRLQSELRQCKDEEKRRELEERLKEYDEVSINVIMLITICQFPCTEVDTNDAKP